MLPKTHQTSASPGSNCVIASLGDQDTIIKYFQFYATPAKRTTAKPAAVPAKAKPATKNVCRSFLHGRRGSTDSIKISVQNSTCQTQAAGSEATEDTADEQAVATLNDSKTMATGDTVDDQAVEISKDSVVFYVDAPPAAEDGHNNLNGSMKAHLSYSHTQNEIVVESPFDKATSKTQNDLARSVFPHSDVDTNPTLQNEMVDAAGEQEADKALQGSKHAETVGTENVDGYNAVPLQENRDLAHVPTEWPPAPNAIPAANRPRARPRTKEDSKAQNPGQNVQDDPFNLSGRGFWHKHQSFTDNDENHKQAEEGEVEQYDYANDDVADEEADDKGDLLENWGDYTGVNNEYIEDDEDGAGDGALDFCRVRMLDNSSLHPRRRSASPRGQASSAESVNSQPQRPHSTDSATRHQAPTPASLPAVYSPSQRRDLVHGSHIPSRSHSTDSAMQRPDLVHGSRIPCHSHSTESAVRHRAPMPASPPAVYSPPQRRDLVHGSPIPSRSHSTDSAMQRPDLIHSSRSHSTDSTTQRPDLIHGSRIPSRSLSLGCSRSRSRSRSRSPPRRARPQSTDGRSQSRSAGSEGADHQQRGNDDDHRGRDRGTRRRLSTPKRLPPSSPQPEELLESDASHSSDDYAAGVAEKQKRRSFALQRGDRVSPSAEDEDEEDERDFERELNAGGLDDEVVVGKRTKKKGSNKHADSGVGGKGKAKAAGDAQETKKSTAGGSGGGNGKGKGKARAAEVEMQTGGVGPSRRSKPKAKKVAEEEEEEEPRGEEEEDVDWVMYEEGKDAEVDSDEEEDEERRGRGKKKGPIPQAIRDSVQAAYNTFLEAVEEIAAESGKSSQSLHQTLGTTIKAPRTLSGWNVWQRYFAEQEGNPEKLDGKEYSQKSRQAFLEALNDASPGFTDKMARDSALVFKTLPWLSEWHDKLLAQAVVDIREAGKTEAQASKRHPARPKYVKQYRELIKFNLNQQVKEMEHTFGVIEMRERGVAVPLPLKSLVANPGEGQRDQGRKLLGRLLANQLWQLGNRFDAWSGVDTDIMTFKMSALEDANLVIGRVGCDKKKIRAETLDKFMPALLEAQKVPVAEGELPEIMAIVSWDDDEMDLPLEEQAEIAVVIAEDGRALVQVKHSDKYHKEVEAGRKKAKKLAEKAAKKGKKGAKKREKPAADSRNGHGSHRVGPDSGQQHTRPESPASEARYRARPDSHQNRTRYESSALERYEGDQRFRTRSPWHAGSSHQPEPHYHEHRHNSRSRSPAHVSHHDPYREQRRSSRSRSPAHVLHHDPYHERRRNSRSRSPLYRPRNSPPSRAAYQDVYYDGRNNDRYRLTTRTESSYQYNNKFGTSAPRNSRANQCRKDVIKPNAKIYVLRTSDLSARRMCDLQLRNLPGDHAPSLCSQLARRNADPVALAITWTRCRASTWPSKRKEMHNGRAEELERAGKRQRLDEEQLSSTLYQLRFIVGKKKSMTWNATGLRKVERASQADEYTFYLTKDAEGGHSGWRPIPKNCTPVLATETDEGRAQFQSHISYKQDGLNLYCFGQKLFVL
ncbi:hypothetical protein B0H14DRAFT_2591302 [Mycena olivaceomarginata]|nr:hypothetical protein B0H14DRAFT_2591302 [Mycena olivaceomarginata]